MAKPNPKTVSISVIIPTLNEAAALPRTLSRVRTALNGRVNYEIIVSDGGSRDGTVSLAAAAGCRVIKTAVGRAPQLNAGARRARGRQLFFLHADTLVPPDLADHLGSTLPSCFQLRFATTRHSPGLRFFSWCSRLDVEAFRFGDQGLLVSASLFRTVAGYRDDMKLLEDQDIARRLRRAAGGFRVLPAAVVTSARKYERHGVWYTQGAFAFIYLLYRLGAGQGLLGRVYRWAFPPA